MSHTMTDSGARSAQRTPPDRRKKPPRGRRRIWRRVLLGLLVVVLALGGTGWWLYHDLDANLQQVDIDKALGEDRPERLPKSGENFLVLGSDSRAGANAALDGGDVSGARSDTTLVVHIPEGRSRATVVSIPRDTLVTRPDCTTSSGRTLPEAERVMFNSVYSLAGPACVVKTVESMSGIRMDHYMEIDFAGFKGLVDALGGVDVTVEQPIGGRNGGLWLDAGGHHLNGEEALRFVRTRHGIGDGSDLGRIGLQQQFLVALLSEVKQQQILTSPTKLYRVADAATRSLTTDSELGSLTALADFGRSLKGIGPDSMETIMMPVAYDKQNPNRVVAAHPQVDQFWKALRTDQPIPESAKKSPATGGSSS